MKVVNWKKWQRTKIGIASLLVLVSIVCIGGLEAEASDPTPSWEGAITCIVLAYAILYNVMKKDKQMGDPWF